MTVGIAAICEHDGQNPKVLLSADRLITTTQQSRIEHEQPEAKLEEFGIGIDGINILGIVSGAISFADEFTNNLSQNIREFARTNPVDVETVAIIAMETYQNYVTEKVNNNVLSKYGVTVDDLSNQHQFKDEFFDDMMEEVHHVQEVVFGNLTFLMGGVDSTGAYIYNISGNDKNSRTRMGYECIGSGQQPAESEFIHSEYDKTCDHSEGLATVAAANLRAKRAAGVGGDMDIGVVGNGYTEFATDEMVERVSERQQQIDDIQSKVRTNLVAHDTIRWDPGP